MAVLVLLASSLGSGRRFPAAVPLSTAASVPASCVGAALKRPRPPSPSTIPVLLNQYLSSAASTPVGGSQRRHGCCPHGRGDLGTVDGYVRVYENNDVTHMGGSNLWSRVYLRASVVVDRVDGVQPPPPLT